MDVSLTPALVLPRRRTRELLTELGLLAVIALSVATITVCGSWLARHYHVLWFAPVAAHAPAPAATDLQTSPGVDEGSEAVAGLVVNGGIQQPAVGVGVTPGKNAIWVPIILYHYIRVAPAGDHLGFELSVTPDEFARQVRFLHDNGYHAITMRDLDVAMRQRTPLPPKPVVLTFDDGYEDFYTTAAPILREYGMPATEYLPTALLGTPRYMTWAEVEELDGEGFEMAAHSEHHVNLAKVPYLQARLEVFGSKAELETRLGHPVVDMAYPYGGFTNAVVGLVRQAGYWSATTTQESGWQDPSRMLLMPRQRIGGAESLAYLARILTQPGTAGPRVAPAPAPSPSPIPAPSPSPSPSAAPASPSPIPTRSPRT